MTPFLGFSDTKKHRKNEKTEKLLAQIFPRSKSVFGGFCAFSGVANFMIKPKHFIPPNLTHV